MVATVPTFAYLGLEARAVEVQCNLIPGLPNFIVVGLPDKAVGEGRERVRGAIAAIGLSLPPKRITITMVQMAIAFCTSPAAASAASAIARRCRGLCCHLHAWWSAIILDRPIAFPENSAGAVQYTARRTRFEA